LFPKDRPVASGDTGGPPRRPLPQNDATRRAPFAHATPSAPTATNLATRWHRRVVGPTRTAGTGSPTATDIAE
jgi:hypothetical protein